MCKTSLFHPFDNFTPNIIIVNCETPLGKEPLEMAQAQRQKLSGFPLRFKWNRSNFSFLSPHKSSNVSLHYAILSGICNNLMSIRWPQPATRHIEIFDAKGIHSRNLTAMVDINFLAFKMQWSCRFTINILHKESLRQENRDSSLSRSISKSGFFPWFI